MHKHIQKINKKYDTNPLHKRLETTVNFQEKNISSFAEEIWDTV